MQEVSNGRAPGRVTMGLNDVVSGGPSPDRPYLVEGEPGSGKPTLALLFLLEGVARGKRSLHVTPSESIQELHDVTASHGWSPSDLSLLRELRPGPGIQLGVPLRQLQGVLSRVPTILQAGRRQDAVQR